MTRKTTTTRFGESSHVTRKHPLWLGIGVWLWAIAISVPGGAGDQADKHRKAAANPTNPSNASPLPTLQELKASGALRSSYRKPRRPVVDNEVPKPRLAEFRKEIKPILDRACVECHGPQTKEGNIRLDTLDPDLLHGEDVNWWLEVLAVLSNGEMPPADADELPDRDRAAVVDWLSSEVQVASTVRRATQGHSSFRRMTRYEYNYALQDLLGLPWNFAKDLPPEANSHDGFQNSSEMLHMSSIQFATYRKLGLKALRRATVRGDRPDVLYWGVSMKAAAATAWAKQEEELDKVRKKHKDDPTKLERELKRRLAGFRGRSNNTYYLNRTSGRTARATWGYPGAKYAWKPATTRPDAPGESEHVAIIPPNKKLIVELGDRVPEEGAMRVRIRASRAAVEGRSPAHGPPPSLSLEFGWQASNDSHASVRISEFDLPIDAASDKPQFYQWDIPLGEIYPRNLVRGISKLGDLPSPSEYVRLVNRSLSGGDIQIDYVEIAAPVYDQWPPAPHSRIFFDSESRDDENKYARAVLTRFLSRAWRRPVDSVELDRKLALFKQIRPACRDFQEAVTEVLATALASPHFLYLTRADRESHKPTGTDDKRDRQRLSGDELVTRLSIFLWSSLPDEQLLEAAAKGRLNNQKVLATQVKRMLADSRSHRFSKHFTRQWLGMQLLDYLNVDRKAYPQFDPALKEALQEEPVAFFHEVLQHDRSVLDFLHADYTVANERLARHYGLDEVYGNHFRRVKLDPPHRRGGLLTQAGLLAMNSDGKDSHPLKRGIWLLERLLNDPPPPPPPAVPEIDLADPEIAKLTLKQRIENHRNQAACLSCHAKIDPWGIAFENFDAVGRWRTQANGKPVDATSLLFNKQELAGMEGLKRYLLSNRQDQFVRAVVHKMTTYALGRPLTFADRVDVDRITADLRRRGDGLATMVELIVGSELFQSK